MQEGKLTQDSVLCFMHRVLPPLDTKAAAIDHVCRKRYLSFLFTAFTCISEVQNCGDIQKAAVPETNLADNGREDSPFSSLTISRIKGRTVFILSFLQGASPSY